MPIDLRTIAEAQNKILVLIENPERRRMLEQFVENSGPLVEAAARDALQVLVEEVNVQLAPGTRLRLVQEGTRVIPEIVSLGDEPTRGRALLIDSDSISKVLVRMPSDVKSRAADAAHKAGTSLNTWTVNVLDRALVSLRERQERASESQHRAEDEGNTPPASGPEDTVEGRDNK